MNTLENISISKRNIVIGGFFLVTGFCLLSVFTWAWWGLFLGGIISWLLVFRGDSLSAFSLPKKIWAIPLGVIIYFLLGTVIGLLSKQLGFSWSANPASGHLASLFLKIPFMLMGEELLGIGILETAKNKGVSLFYSTLLSALIFGLMHVFVYWDGSVFSTLLHVLLLQGVARLIFNYIYLITGKSVWGSWATHVLVDIIALSA